MMKLHEPPWTWRRLKMASSLFRENGVFHLEFTHDRIDVSIGLTSVRQDRQAGASGGRLCAQGQRGDSSGASSMIVACPPHWT